MSTTAGSAPRRRVVLSWSSGKDSYWALLRLRRDPTLEVAGLLTTINVEAQRVAMHAVRRRLLQDQAAALGLPLQVIDLPHPCDNADYEARMGAAVARLREEGIEAVAFGDLFLQDVRDYRERQLQGTGLAPLFPLWGLPTRLLSRQLVASGVRAMITCLDPRAAPRELCGRAYDRALLQALPAGVDPCGERGEFHTFVHAGPLFERPLSVTPGPIVEREGFLFADVV